MFFSLPGPTPPSTQHLLALLPYAFNIAIGSLAISIGMAQIYASIYNYQVDANQVKMIKEFAIFD